MSSNVVIVDSQDESRKNLKILLNHLGYEVVGEGENGREAIELSEKLKPDLILMDVEISEMDGIITAREINQRVSLPIILYAVKRDEKMIQRVKDSGVMAYLVKPIREEELKVTIELAISRFDELKVLRKEIKELKETIETRKIIERAKGILMERQRLKERDAFRKLQKFSMDKRKPMKKVAEAIIIAYEIDP
jgi:response regulator NasT